jgi:predicted 3-demethylubiquinone-9 3-methyltransferase (glyoxalase superfamily)
MPATMPCLWFDGTAEEAAQHYVSIFPNSEITSVTRYGPGMHFPEGTALTVEWTLDGRPYLGLNGGPDHQFSEAISFQIACADQDEVDHYWSRLSEGGQEGPCGWLKDRYGVSWQVVPTRLPELLGDPDPARAQRAMQAMLQMGKIIVADVERAADSVPA